MSSDNALPLSPEAEMARCTVDRDLAGDAMLRLLISADAHFAQLRRRIGVGPNERLALEFLWSFGQMSMSELADRLAVTRAAVTTLIDRMEEDGYIDRIADLTDRRRTLLSLSPVAHERMAEQIRPWGDSVQELFNDMSDEEWAHTGALMRGLYDITIRETDEIRGTGSKQAARP